MKRYFYIIIFILILTNHTRAGEKGSRFSFGFRGEIPIESGYSRLAQSTLVPSFSFGFEYPFYYGLFIYSNFSYLYLSPTEGVLGVTDLNYGIFKLSLGISKDLLRWKNFSISPRIGIVGTIDDADLRLVDTQYYDISLRGGIEIAGRINYFLKKTKKGILKKSPFRLGFFAELGLSHYSPVKIELEAEKKEIPEGYVHHEYSKIYLGYFRGSCLWFVTGLILNF